MVRLEIADYCGNCDKFSATVSSETIFADGDVFPMFTVRCENRNLCESIKEYMERKDKNNGKSHDHPGQTR
jgi:hypothetical protein